MVSLQSIGDSSQLIVNGKPFLILGAELHNSTASTINFLEPIWPKLVDYHINTVFLPVSWEQVEPEEGKFDFKLLDRIIEKARFYKLKLVLLWFGSFKNAESSYIPRWMKVQPKKYPRSQLFRNGKLLASNTLSVFHDINCDTDAKAVMALMDHLKIVNHDETVIMVQLENESGVSWDSRDRSEQAMNFYNKQVPQKLLDYLQTHPRSEAFNKRFPDFPRALSGTWREVFGDGYNGDEVFMAWHYALYIEKIAAAAKSRYSIPLYVNAALNTPDSRAEHTRSVPGNYPSGGAVAQTIDIYKAVGNNIDIYAPDCYWKEFEETAIAFRHAGNPLLIPETRRDSHSAERLFFAFGALKAIGVSPFGIDSVWEESVLYKKHYGVLAQVSDQILKCQRDNTIFGFHFTNDPVVDTIVHKFPSGLIAHIDRIHSYGKPQSGFGLIMQTSDEEFLGVGYGYTVKFTSVSGRRPDIISCFEGHYPDGKWEVTRRLNGDETGSMTLWQFSSVTPDFGTYKVPIFYPATTGISKCQIYLHEDIYGTFPWAM